MKSHIHKISGTTFWCCLLYTSKELVLVNCCDTIRSVYDILKDSGQMDFLYMIDKMCIRDRDDISTDGLPLIRQIVEMFEVAGIDTQIICASVRHPIHVTECALAGADIATVPYKVLEQMTKHPLTDAGIEKFQKDYKAVFGDK